MSRELTFAIRAKCSRWAWFGFGLSLLPVIALLLIWIVLSELAGEYV